MEISNKEKDNLYYLCYVIEALGRKTKNRRKTVVDALGKNNIDFIYKNAEVMHSEPIDAVCYEFIQKCNIKDGDYDIEVYCKEKPPRALAIGKLYSRLVLSLLEDGEDLISKTIEVLSSWLVDEITNFNSSLYYSVLGYLKECYLQGEILDY
ncbi:hypothetical protein ACFLKB_14070 [Clostridium sp. FAM 1755]|uniref:hypothetical protein n=1 Tax=Clostridium TaxID=1485 RepID=UPI0006AB7B79|nr:MULTISPECIES: hypothetical protein [Clostridium]KOR26716.1 hypothetical protein ND00_02430 [Clostridium sp. L74]NFV11557.1 hypothetical protein [Clostridium sporogenes]